MSSDDRDYRWHHRQDEADAYRWFHDLYYDPAAEAAAGVERRYRWQPQDTISPYEVLQAQFANKLDRSTISEISTDLSEKSSNWRARPDEFSDLDPPFEARKTSYGQDKPDKSRSDLLSAIAALEIAIGTLERPPPAFGHNMPPEGILDDPQTCPEVRTLTAILNQMKVQATASIPNTAVVTEQKAKLVGVGQTIMSWGGARGTKFVDAVIDSSGKALGAALVLQLTGILPQIFDVISAATKFATAFSH